VVVIEPDDVLRFLHPLPARALWGVGPATLSRLERFGVRTVGDIAALPEATLVGALGTANGRHLSALAHGIDDRAVVPDQAPKSIGHEETFPTDHHTLEPLAREVVRMADSVGARLRHHGLAGRTVTLKVRFGDFRTITRSTTVPSPLDEGPAIARAARTLLAQVDPSPGVRLLGVTVSGLASGAARQLTLDDATGAGWHEASGAVDAIRERFGDAAIGPGSIVGRDGLRVRGTQDNPWGPSENG
jgi:DNA polymerase IV